MPGMHQNYRMVAMYAIEGGGGATSDYINTEAANWVTIVITEDNLSGVGTAHNWSITAASQEADAGSDTEVITTGIRVFSETDIASAALIDTFAEATVSSGLFAADTTTTTWSVHVIELDPAAIPAGKPWIALVHSAGSANSNAHAVAYLETKYKQALTPTAVA